jgi:hypothetical protein
LAHPPCRGRPPGKLPRLKALKVSHRIVGLSPSAILPADVSVGTLPCILFQVSLRSLHPHCVRENSKPIFLEFFFHTLYKEFKSEPGNPNIGRAPAGGILMAATNGKILNLLMNGSGRAHAPLPTFLSCIETHDLEMSRKDQKANVPVYPRLRCAYGNVLPNQVNIPDPKARRDFIFTKACVPFHESRSSEIKRGAIKACRRAEPGTLRWVPGWLKMMSIWVLLP